MLQASSATAARTRIVFAFLTTRGAAPAPFGL
jgi:hypothetical protein